MKTWIKVVIGVAVLAVLAVTAGPFIYINFIKEDAPPEFTLAPGGSTTATASGDPDTTTDPGTTTDPDASGAGTTTAGGTATTTGSSGDTAGGLDGTWTIADGSQVGYRVVEVLFGQDTEGVGRTPDVSGSIELSGTQVTGALFTADMTTVESDESRRDGQFSGRIMDTATYPTATFELTSPIELGAIPADGEQITATATGDLTLRGTTNPVTFDVQAQLRGGQIQIVGSTDVVFEDYGIPNPSTGGITTQDHGLLEFSLFLTKS